MTESQSRKKSLNPLNLFKKQINPEFIDFVERNLKEIKEGINHIKDLIKDKEYKEIFTPKFNQILENLSTMEKNFTLYSTKFKYYTEETERSIRKFGFLVKEFLQETQFNISAYKTQTKEIYILNIVNQWTNFNSEVKSLFYNIEHNDYPYTIHTLFSLAFVLVPFLNIFSLVGGIYLVLKKDWRALIFGAITLILYFIQFINVINLAVVG